MRIRIRPGRPRRLAVRLTVYVLALLIALLAAAGGTFGYFSYGVQRQAILEAQRAMAEKVALIVPFQIEGVLRSLGSLGTNNASALQRGDEIGLCTAFEYFMQNNPEFGDLVIFDQQGNEVAHASQYRISVSAWQDNQTEAQTEQFDRAIQGENYVSQVYIGVASGSNQSQPFIVVSGPVKDQRGQVMGVVAANVNLDYLWTIIAKTQVGENGSIYVIDQDGHLIAHQDPYRVLLQMGSSDFPALTRAIEDAVGVTQSQYKGWDGQEVVGTFVPVENLGWWVIVEQPTAEVFSGIYSALLTRILPVGGLILVAAAIISFLSINRLARPLQALATAARRIGSGQWDVSLPPAGEDEVGLLSQAFGTMTAQVRQMMNSEREQRAHLEATVAGYMTFVTRVAEGDLIARLPLEDEDELGNPLIVLGRNLNEMTVDLQQAIFRIRDTANSLSSAAAGILATTTQQAVGAGEQSAAIVQASSTIDEVRAIARQTSERAEGVAELAQCTAEVSRTGELAVVDTIEGMQEVKTKVETIATNILALSEQAQAVGQIIATVNEIAAQSNMLALNAAVEAARAGEAGKGFAVVAAEVRSLAEQSHGATVQVKEILQDIQRGVNAAVMATEEGMKMADAGMKLAGEAGLSIQRLTEGVTESAQAAQQIAVAAGQQQTGIEQIALTMDSIRQVTTQSVAGAQQVERAAEELNELAGQLRELVEQYQL